MFYYTEKDGSFKIPQSANIIRPCNLLAGRPEGTQRTTKRNLILHKHFIVADETKLRCSIVGVSLLCLLNRAPLTCQMGHPISKRILTWSDNSCFTPRWQLPIRGVHTANRGKNQGEICNHCHSLCVIVNIGMNSSVFNKQRFMQTLIETIQEFEWSGRKYSLNL